MSPKTGRWVLIGETAYSWHLFSPISYDMNPREATEFIRVKIGTDAVEKIEHLIKRQRVRAILELPWAGGSRTVQAAKGGYTPVCSLPKKSLDHSDLVQLKGAILKKTLSCKVSLPPDLLSQT